MVSSPSPMFLEMEFEPDIIDYFSLTPFALSQVFTNAVEGPLSRSSWHGLWVMPISLALNISAVPLLIVAAAVNLLISAIAYAGHKTRFGSHRLSLVHDTLFYAGISLIRSFSAAYNPLKVMPGSP